MKSIEKQELERLVDVNHKLYSLKNNLADIELSIMKLKTDKVSIFDQLDSLNDEFRQLEKELTDKYGNVSINLSTGEIKE